MDCLVWVEYEENFAKVSKLVYGSIRTDLVQSIHDYKTVPVEHPEKGEISVPLLIVTFQNAESLTIAKVEEDHETLVGVINAFDKDFYWDSVDEENTDIA